MVVVGEGEEGREAKYAGGGWVRWDKVGRGTDFSPVVGAACGVRGRSGGRSIMMQRWRGCGTLELARALAIGRSANHSFGNNRLHTLHTKDTREPGKELPRTGAAPARFPPTIPSPLLFLFLSSAFPPSHAFSLSFSLSLFPSASRSAF